MSEPPVRLRKDSLADRLEEAPQSLLLGAAFVLGAVVGTTVTLLARRDEDVPSGRIRRNVATPSAHSDNPVATLKHALTEEATHVVRAVGTQLAEVAAAQVRDYVIGAWLGQDDGDDVSSGDENRADDDRADDDRADEDHVDGGPTGGPRPEEDSPSASLGNVRAQGER